MVAILAIVFILTCSTFRQAVTVNFESLPAVAMDYRVKIEAGKEDCYFQFVSPGATFYVSFQVRMNCVGR